MVIEGSNFYFLQSAICSAEQKLALLHLAQTVYLKKLTRN
jgi:hypothetical protein